MGQPASHTICCSFREKQYEQGIHGVFPMGAGPPQFQYNEVQVNLQEQRFAVFAPFWNREGARRLAVASEREVHVYRFCDEDFPRDLAALMAFPGEGATQRFGLEWTLELPEGQEVTSICFTDDSSSKTLAVASAPTAGSNGGKPRVRVWNCDPPEATEGRDFNKSAKSTATWTLDSKSSSWDVEKHCVATLEEHGDAITKFAASTTFLLTADAKGNAVVWQKSKGFTKRATARLHQGKIADLAVDRFFVYSAGFEDLLIRAWSVPDLTSILTIQASVPRELLCSDPAHNARGLFEDLAASAAGAMEAAGVAPRAPPYQLCAVTAVRRPVSRWAGSQGSTRSAKVPKGMLFVGGTLGEQSSEVAGVGAGILMEWTLGEHPACISAQVAHDSPIVAIAYGPYDNGPVITADTQGVFRVWDCVPRLTCSQRLQFPAKEPAPVPALSATAPPPAEEEAKQEGIGSAVGATAPQCVAIAMEPQVGLYTTTGDDRLCIWRRTVNNDFS